MIQIPDTLSEQVAVSDRAAGALDAESVHRQVAALCRALGIRAESLRGKRVLDVGSRFGLFVAMTRLEYGMESYGLEPAGSVAGGSREISRSLLRANGLAPELVVDARAEAIPFPDDHFDLVVSSGALDRSGNPERVLDESVRVLKPEGSLHFAFPNQGRLRRTSPMRIRRWIASRRDVQLVAMGEEPAAARRWARSSDPIVLTLRKQVVASVRPLADNQQIYDENWPQWLDMKRHGPSSRWLRALIGDLIDGRLRDADTKRVLDFGCGEGSTTEFLARKLPIASVLGIDQSSSGIDCANSYYRAPNLEFRHEPGGAVLRDASFDLVTCFEVLEHVEDWQALAHRLARATSRYLLVSFPTGRMRDFEVNVGHLRNFRPGEFESFMERAGFRTVEVLYAGFPFYSPLFRDVCNLTNSGGKALTKGRYSFWTRRLGDLIYLCFRVLSTRRRHGDQFCGLFEVAGPIETR